jgi:hypothetical protein
MKSDTKEFREVAGIFNNNIQLQAAINELTIAHFERYEISVIGSEAAMKEKFAVEAKDPHQLIDNPLTPRGINITPEEKGIGEGVAIGGGMLAGVIGALIIAGGITVSTAVPSAIIGGTVGAAFGELIADFIGSASAKHIQKQIEQGGLILWVHTNNKEKEQLAYNILKKYGAEDVHTHDIAIEAFA